MRFGFLIIAFVFLIGCTQSSPLAPIDIPDVASPLNSTSASVNIRETEIISANETAPAENITEEDLPAENEIAEESMPNASEDALCTPEQQQACEDACAKDPDGEACFYECVLVWGCP